jgi:hypothetical protein
MTDEETIVLRKTMIGGQRYGEDYQTDLARPAHWADHEQQRASRRTPRNGLGPVTSTANPAAATGPAILLHGGRAWRCSRRCSHHR